MIKTWSRIGSALKPVYAEHAVLAERLLAVAEVGREPHLVAKVLGELQRLGAAVADVCAANRAPAGSAPARSSC